MGLISRYGYVGRRNSKIVKCDEKDGFKISAKKLKKVISKKTKWLILNSPSNPTGAGYTKKEIEELGEVLLKNKNVFILSDDIYEHIRYDNFNFYTIAQIPKLKERTLTMNGVSKSYAMTGWRIGYAAGPKRLSLLLERYSLSLHQILHL